MGRPRDFNSRWTLIHNGHVMALPVDMSVMALLVNMSWRYWWTCHGVTAESYFTFWRIVAFFY